MRAWKRAWKRRNSKVRDKCARRSGGSERNIKAEVKMINVKRMRKDIMEIELNMNEKEENKGVGDKCVRRGHYNETPGSE